MKTSEDFLKETLASAKELYQKYKEIWQKDPRLQTLLQEFQKGLRESEEAYRQTQASALCLTCAQEDRSCCRRGMELEVSRELLILNLLLGTTLPSRRRYSRGCFFLGENGCLLTARPILCRNFFCPWFQQKMPLQKLRYLQEKQERECVALFQILDHLRGYLLQKD